MIYLWCVRSNSKKMSDRYVFLSSICCTMWQHRIYTPYRFKNISLMCYAWHVPCAVLPDCMFRTWSFSINARVHIIVNGKYWEETPNWNNYDNNLKYCAANLLPEWPSVRWNKDKEKLNTLRTGPRVVSGFRTTPNPVIKLESHSLQGYH